VIKTQDEIKTMIHNGNCRNSDKLGKPLSDSELQIIEQLLAGNNRQQIASNLSKSENTIRNQIVSICDKLELNDTTGIVAYAYQANVLMGKILSLSIGGK